MLALNQTPLLLTLPIIWKSHKSPIVRFLLIHEFHQAKFPLAFRACQVSQVKSMIWVIEVGQAPAADVRGLCAVR